MRVVLSLAVLMLPLWRLVAVEFYPETFYLQFVIGTTEDKPPAPDAKRIGEKLGGLLTPVYKWEHYWEVRRHTVILAKDQMARIRLTAERELEVELIDPAHLELRSYRQGELRRKVALNARKTIHVMGGDTDGENGWFFVVRRDKPSTR